MMLRITASLLRILVQDYKQVFVLDLLALLNCSHTTSSWRFKRNSCLFFVFINLNHACLCIQLKIGGAEQERSFSLKLYDIELYIVNYCSITVVVNISDVLHLALSLFNFFANFYLNLWLSEWFLFSTKALEPSYFQVCFFFLQSMPSKHLSPFSVILQTLYIKSWSVKYLTNCVQSV